MEYAIIPYEERKWTVYVHVNKINGKKYVGITSKDNPNKRWRNGRGYEGNKHFYGAIKQYGWDNFQHVIVKTGLTQFEVGIYETALIAILQTRDTEFGYNHYIGGFTGSLGLKMSQECCDKKRGFNNFRSKPVVCLNDRKVYGSLNLAAIDKNLSNGYLIAPCCNKESQYAGISENGEYLKWMWLSDYQVASQDEIDEILHRPVLLTNSQQVICLNNGNVFNSTIEAAYYGGLKQSSGVIRCCCKYGNRPNGTRSYAGTDPVTNERLVWMYLEDYYELAELELDKLQQSVNKIVSSDPQKKKLICLNTLEVFESTVDVEKYSTASSKNIKIACNNASRFCGRNNQTGEGLHWKYYDDYLSLTIEEKQKLYDQYYTGHFLLPKKEECA